MQYFFSLLVHWPLYLALKLKADVLHHKKALLWYEDAANFPKQNFFQLLAKRPYYREILYYRLGSLGAFFRHIYPAYEHFKINSPRDMVLGGGIYLDHPYYTVLNAKSIGKNFKTKHMVTIGNNNNQIPVIGDNVFIGCGAVVLGGIVVGDNVKIGANCVVVKNVPKNCTVVGSPAYIVKQNGMKVWIKL
jgi:serine O-acetyltransferase